MTTPISSTVTPVVHQPEEAATSSPPATTRVVTLPPVVVQGDVPAPAASVTQLVKAHDAATRRDCGPEAANAVVGGVGVAGVALGIIGGAATGGLATAGVLLGLFVASFGAGHNAREYYECKKQ